MNDKNISHGKRIVIAGGTGLIGKSLTNYFRSNGYEVVILTRQNQKDDVNLRYLQWDAKNLDDWKNELDGAFALINLTGKSVNCRYTRKNKAQIYSSRLDSTKILAHALKNLSNPPKCWINASSATIYRDSMDRDMDEVTGEIGTGFSVDVCQKWEQELFSSSLPNVRRIAIRLSIVLSADKGGAMDYFVGLAKAGLAGKMGSGKQFFSWIHIKDVISSIQYILDSPYLEGPINCCAPNPLSNSDFFSILRKEVGMPIAIPSAKWMLEIGAFFLRTETELLLKSRRVVPKKLMDSGFSFQFETIQHAIKDILQK